VLLLLLASCIAVAPASIEPTSSDSVDLGHLSEARRLFDEGNARYDAADYKGAIEVFTLALREIHGKGVDDFRVRALLLFNIGRTHMRAYEIYRDIEHLRQARSIFSRLVDEFERFPGEVEAEDVAAAHENLTEVERMLAAAESSGEPLPPKTETLDHRPIRARGIGLTGAGVVLLGAGIGMLAWGSGFGAAAESQVAGLDDLGLPSDSPAFADGDDFIAAERRKGTAWMVAGGVSAALGVTGAAIGIMQLVKAKKLQQRSLSAGVSPGVSISREGVWLSVGGRF
jgi:tetratricopeptide (TPR) repeat protein